MAVLIRVSSGSHVGGGGFIFSPASRSQSNLSDLSDPPPLPVRQSITMWMVYSLHIESVACPGCTVRCVMGTSLQQIHFKVDNR